MARLWTRSKVDWNEFVKASIRCARESTEIEVQPAAVHGRPAEMVMNAAYPLRLPDLWGTSGRRSLDAPRGIWRLKG